MCFFASLLSGKRGRFAAASVIAAAGAGLAMCSSATADPLPGEVLKFYQAPLNNAGPLYPIGAVPTSLDNPASPAFPGHDELSTATLTATTGLYTGTMMADDFGDLLTTPIVHVEFWGSYMDGTNNANGGVQKFQITFYTDNPGSSANGAPSSPLTPYSSQTVTFTPGPLTPHDGKFTEQLVKGTTGAPGTGDSPLYQYNAELAVPVPEPVPLPVGNVDWISIVALTDPTDPNPNILWGWHDRDYGIFDPLATTPPLTVPGEHNEAPPGLPPVWNFQDDAVSNNTFELPPTGGLPTENPAAYVPQNYIPGIDISPNYPTESKDLAFALYTTAVPEPTGLILLAGVAALARRNRRKQAAC